MATSISDQNLEKFLTRRIFRSIRPFSSEGCSICLAPYDTNHKAVRVRFKGCSHRFGRECLENWLLSDNPNSHCCPVCRKEWYNISETSTHKFSPLHCIQSLRIRLEQKSFDRKVNKRLAQRQIEYTIIPQTEGIELESDFITAIDSRLTVFGEIGLDGYVLPADTHDRLQDLEVRLGALRQNITERSRERASTNERRMAESFREEILQNFEEFENAAAAAARRRRNAVDHVEVEEDDIVEELLDYYATIEEEEEDGTGSVLSRITTADLGQTYGHPLEASPTRVSHMSNSSLVTRSPHASSTSLESVSSISSVSSSTTFYSAAEQLNTDAPAHLVDMQSVLDEFRRLNNAAIQETSLALEELRA